MRESSPTSAEFVALISGSSGRCFYTVALGPAVSPLFVMEIFKESRNLEIKHCRSKSDKVMNISQHAEPASIASSDDITGESLSSIKR